MTLLIVDDQSRVVRGIIDGVNWQADGFDTVLAAYNAAEARRVLAQQPVDVMLCDIEMPVENGLSLVEWTQNEGLPTKCIFLTSHMSFEYAQKALRLGSVDYLVLPTPYPDIRQAVLKAMGQIESFIEKEELRQYGQQVREREDSLLKSLFRSFLMSGDMESLKDGRTLGHLPTDDTLCYLAVVQVLRQEGGLEQWEPQALRYAISNIMAELFDGYGQRCLCVEDGHGYLCYLIFGEDTSIDLEVVVRQLEYLIGVGAEHLNSILACYTDLTVPLSEISHLYKILLRRLQGNVALQSGVFHTPADGQMSIKDMYSHTRYSRWLQELRDGYVQAVRSESIAFLDDLRDKGQLTVETLHLFYQSMAQLFTHVTSEHNCTLHDLYGTRETFEIYRSGDQSLDHIKRFINLSLDALDRLNVVYPEGTFQVERVVRYIHDHLGEDIRRTDIAEHFHLNPDYLTRVFKKETGKTLIEFITGEKIAIAKSLLRTTSLPVGIIAAKVGYGSFSHFSKVYNKVTGLTPSEERHNARNE